jgi:2-haloacid dehalogenase
MIRNILFDLDDTLLDFRIAERVALAKTLQHLGIEPKDVILSRYSELNLSQWRLLELGQLTREEVKVRRFQLLFNEIGVDCCASYTTEYYENLLGVGHFFMAGAEELLRALSGNYRLFLVSNGSADVQKRRIKSAGMDKYFDNIFFSQQIGFEKPNKAFFDYCFTRIPYIKCHETLIVGDSLSSDVKGGKNAGIITVWFNPDNSKNLSDIIPDYEVCSLLELIPLLKTI